MWEMPTRQTRLRGGKKWQAYLTCFPINYKICLALIKNTKRARTCIAFKHTCTRHTNIESFSQLDFQTLVIKS